MQLRASASSTRGTGDARSAETTATVPPETRMPGPARTAERFSASLVTRGTASLEMVPSSSQGSPTTGISSTWACTCGTMHEGTASVT